MYVLWHGSFLPNNRLAIFLLRERDGCFGLILMAIYILRLFLVEAWGLSVF